MTCQYTHYGAFTVMEKKNRKIKVYSKSQSLQGGYFSKYKEVPAILLSGEWLAKCNFNIGDRINVEVSDGQLVVKKELLD